MQIQLLSFSFQANYFNHNNEGNYRYVWTIAYIHILNIHLFVSRVRLLGKINYRIWYFAQWKIALAKCGDMNVD